MACFLVLSCEVISAVFKSFSTGTVDINVELVQVLLVFAVVEIAVTIVLALTSYLIKRERKFIS